jgi:hypothetical protein
MNPKQNPSQQYLNLINDMLTDNLFNNASEYLKSVKKYIQENNKITEAQKKAVNNIYIKFSEKI